MVKRRYDQIFEGGSMSLFSRRDWKLMKRMPPALYALYRQSIATRRALGARSMQERLQALLWADAWCLLTQLRLDKEQWDAGRFFGAPLRYLH
jgi:hypothetical protein